MFRHQFKDKLLKIQTKKSNNHIRKEKLKDNKMKLETKLHVDKNNPAADHTIKQDYLVVTGNMKRHRNKFQTIWEPQPTKVIDVKGNSILVERGGVKFMRNSTHGKPFKSNKITNNYPIRKFENFSVSTEYLPPNFDSGLMKDTNDLFKRY